MPAPTNISAATAIDLGAFPTTVVQSVDDAGTTYTVWYKATLALGEYGIWPFGDLTTYRPKVNVYRGPLGAESKIVGGGENLRVQFPVDTPVEYFFEFVTNAGNPTPASLAIDAVAHTTVVQPSGSIAVNDDSFLDDSSGPFPLAILSGTANYTPLRYVLGFQAGEMMDRLDDGRILASDGFNGDNLKLYDNAYGELATIMFLVGGGSACRAQRTLNRFYVGSDNFNPIRVKVYDADGNELSTHDLTGNTAIHGIAANNAGTILYHAPSNVGGAIRRWDLVNDVQLSDLAPNEGTVNVANGFDILVLADDSILVSYVNGATGEIYVKQFDPAGTLLNTYNIVATSNTETTARLAYGLDSTSFWVFYHLAVGTDIVSHFVEIRVSDGAVLTTRLSMEYEVGVYNGAATATPLTDFGNSFSCSFIILGDATPPPPSCPGLVSTPRIDGLPYVPFSP